MLNKSLTIAWQRFLLVSFLLLWCINGVEADTPELLSNPHGHPTFISDLYHQLSAEMKIVESAPDEGLRPEDITLSPGQAYEAFTTYNPAMLHRPDQLFVKELKSGRVYEIQNLPQSHRPFSSLVWINEHTFVFDRWSQPHYGVHYVVNVNQWKLVVASTFPDQRYLDRQVPEWFPQIHSKRLNR